MREANREEGKILSLSLSSPMIKAGYSCPARVVVVPRSCRVEVPVLVMNLFGLKLECFVFLYSQYDLVICGK